MAQFGATISGARGEASRLGNKVSGITAHVNGWDSGVMICARYTEAEGDVIEIHATRGSNKRGYSSYLGYVRADGTFVPNKPDV